MKERFTGRPASALKLALLCAVVGGGLALLGGWSLRVPLGLAGFFLVVAVLEFLATGRTRREPPPPVARSGSKTVTAGEFVEYPFRGGETTCFGTVMPLAGRDVYLDLRCDDLLEARIQAARDLARGAIELARDFDDFKRAEAVRQPSWAEEILGLEIELITFHHKEKPDAGEVYFTLPSGHDRWFCTYLDGKFGDLSQES